MVPYAQITSFQPNVPKPCDISLIFLSKLLSLVQLRLTTNRNIEGNWDVADNGVFTHSNSIVTFDGATDNCTIDTGGESFAHLVINKDGLDDTITVQNDALTVTGDLTIQEGELNVDVTATLGDAGSDAIERFKHQGSH